MHLHVHFSTTIVVPRLPYLFNMSMKILESLGTRLVPSLSNFHAEKHTNLGGTVDQAMQLYYIPHMYT